MTLEEVERILGETGDPPETLGRYSVDFFRWKTEDVEFDAAFDSRPPKGLIGRLYRRISTNESWKEVGFREDQGILANLRRWLRLN
jgi:hypothetical protein